MKFAICLASFMAVTAAVAIPRRDEYCLCQEEAETIVTDFIGVLDHQGSGLGDANATAQALLDDSYQEISDSILSLEGQPLGGVTFQGKQEYITGVLSAPPTEGITTVQVLVAGCNRILWYWNFLGVGSGQYEVKGFNLLTVTPQMQIQMAEIEFNSIAWGLDIGYQLSQPATSNST